MGKIFVCDAIMGTGKTQAAIRFINDNPEKKVIYVTPYLDEVDRLLRDCGEDRLCVPDSERKNGGSKVRHTEKLIRQGKSVATTHSAIKRYTKEMAEEIARQDYTLIVDEALDSIEPFSIKTADVELLLAAGFLGKREDGSLYWTGKRYDGEKFSAEVQILQSHDVVYNPEKQVQSGYHVIFPKWLLEAFSCVYVLTYLFEGQMMKYCLDLQGLSYEKIGVRRTPEGAWCFAESWAYVPDYVPNLPGMIHILDHPINNVGQRAKEQWALSEHWFRNGKEYRERIRRNLYNYFRNIMQAPAKDIMWGTFSAERRHLETGGIKKGYVVFNARATNNFKDRTVLAYCANVFMNVGVRNYLKDAGVEVDDGAYALSTMIQWIWRSAIREGHEVWLYVPSARMRGLLTDWIRSTAKEAAENAQAGKTLFETA